MDCITELVREEKCPVCGETFPYWPRWHHWKARVNGLALECVCSYHCMRKIERQEEENRRKAWEALEKKTDNEEKPEKPMAQEEREVRIKAEIARCKGRLQPLIDEENKLIEDFIWYNMPRHDREIKRKRRYYWQRRISLLEEELAFIQAAKKKK